MHPAVDRAFVNNNYTQYKAQDPELPFIVRECEGAQPCIAARYDFGVERRVYVQNASDAEVSEEVEKLIAQAEQINSSAAPRF